MTTQPDDNDLLTTEQAAAYLSTPERPVSVRMIWHYVETGKLPRRTFGKAFVFRRADLDTLRSSGRMTKRGRPEGTTNRPRRPKRRAQTLR